MKKLLSFTLSLLVFVVAVVGVMVTKSETTKAQTPGSGHVSAIILLDYYNWDSESGSSLSFSSNMDLALQTPTSVDPALNLGPSGFNCSNGGTFNVPISATGEVAGFMASYYDSPPVEFLNNIVAGGRLWIGHIEGLYSISYNYHGGITGQWYQPLSSQISGIWNDAWTSTTTNVSCRTISASMGECTIPAKNQGPITVTLQRSVGEITWAWGASPYFYSPPDQIMQSTATINCLASAPALEVISATHSPVSPNQDDPVSFNGTIKNTGNQTSNAFTPVLYIDEYPIGNWDITISATSASAALAQGAQSDVTWTDAWTAIAPGPGTTIHRYKICPDSTSAETSCLVKNMEVLPNPIPPPVVNPPTADLWIVQTDVTDHSKNSTTIARGGSTKLGWSATNATSCTGSWLTTGNLATLDGEVTQNNLTASKTYSLYCSRDGINSPTDTVTVNINNFAIGNFREL